MADTQPVETTVEQSGKVKFGMQGLNNPTPKWATYIFRAEFLLNKAIMLFFYSDLTPLQIKILACIDFLVWGAGRFVGVKKEDYEA